MAGGMTPADSLDYAITDYYSNNRRSLIWKNRMTPMQFKEARKAMGLSQKSLAEHMDVGKRTIERIEAGEGCSTVMALAMERLEQIVGHD